MIFFLFSLIGLVITVYLIYVVNRVFSAETITLSPEQPTYETPGELRGDEELPTRILTLTGWLKIPKRVYKDDSHELQLKLSKVLSGEPVRAPLKGEGVSKLNNFSVSYEAKWIEVELQAPAMKIDGKNPQQILIDTNMDFRWTLHHLTSGNQTILLIFRAGSEKNPPKQIGVLHRSIRVNRVDGLLSRQVWMIGLGTGIITVISTILGIFVSLQELGVISTNLTPTP